MEGLALLATLALVTVGGRWLLANGSGAGQTVNTPTLVPWPTDTPSPVNTAVPSPTGTLPPTDTPPPSSTPTSTPMPNPAPTLTPTANIADNPALDPTPFPTLALPEGPIMVLETPTGNQPWPDSGPMPPVEQPDNTINIVVMGSDQAAGDQVGRTDVVVVVSINPEIPSASLLSIPRDFYAWLPGRGFNKINTAFAYGEKYEYPGGGPGLIKATIEYNLGIRIHYYARVSYGGFIQIVNALGGVDVAVECPLSDTFPDPESPSGQTDVDWLPGIHHLDGKHALWYVRSRYRTSDFDRNRRQQHVLRGLYSQITSLDIIPKLPELWTALKQAVSTDLGLGEMLYLANVATRLDMSNVKSRFVGPSVVEVKYTPTGAYVLAPKRDALRDLVGEAMAPPAAGRAQQRPFRVEVLNASPWAELGHVAAERLRWENFEVTAVGRADDVRSRTQIFDYTTTSKGSPISHLMRLYGRTSSDVISQPSQGSPIDFLVVLGSDYNPCIAPWVTS